MSRADRHPASGGFTLLELLVAIAIFAILGSLALSGYTELQRQSEYAEQRLERMREVQRAVQTLGQDLAQIEPRPDPRAARRGAPARGARRRRGGIPAASSPARAGATRRASSGRRCSASAIASTRTDCGATTGPCSTARWRIEPVRTKLLGGVRCGALPLHELRSASWVERWPASERPAGRRRPRSVRRRWRSSLELEDWGEIRRLVEVAG